MELRLEVGSSVAGTQWQGGLLSVKEGAGHRLGQAVLPQTHSGGTVHRRFRTLTSKLCPGSHESPQDSIGAWNTIYRTVHRLTCDV